MRILLTNDDSIHDEGMAVLERIAAQFSDDVWVVAPQSDQSGIAHAMTINAPLRVQSHGPKCFAVSGTPTDCVIMAIREILPEPPDLVLSGVNSGNNIGDFVNYSGTVAGAMEGMLMGVKSIALSQGYNYHGERVVPWATAEKHSPAIIEQVIAMDMPSDTFINVNFPNCGPDEIAGTEVVRQGKFVHSLNIEERSDGRAFPYYWIRFAKHDPEHQPGSDIYALEQNRIAISPLKMDLTHETFLATMRERFTV